MQNPANRNICIYKNAEFEETYTFTNDGTGDPIDMTGWSARAQLRKYNSADAPILCDFIVDMSQASSGCIKLQIDNTVTAALPFRISAHYDLLMIDTSGDQKFYIKGTAMIIDTVTVI